MTVRSRAGSYLSDSVPPVAFPIKSLLIKQGMPKSSSGNKVTRPDSSGKPHQRFSFGSDGGDGVQLVFFFFIALLFPFQSQTI